MDANGKFGRAVIRLGRLITHKSSDIKLGWFLHSITRNRRLPSTTGIDKCFWPTDEERKNVAVLKGHSSCSLGQNLFASTIREE
jgi:hypothetical protein